MASRSTQANIALAMGITLFCVTSTLGAQTAARVTTANNAWIFGFEQGLQSLANFAKIVELGTFIFSAYQFWRSRQERKQADVAAACRALIDSNYQAWQVINSAQGKGGSGGRIEALGDLLRNGVALAGINLDDAWLEDVQLAKAVLVRSSLQRANLARANLADANLEGADLSDAELIAADLRGANLKGANLSGARFSAATFDGADLTDVLGWRQVRSYGHSSIEGVRNAPHGFAEFARELGAVDSTTSTVQLEDSEHYSRLFRAI